MPMASAKNSKKQSRTCGTNKYQLINNSFKNMFLPLRNIKLFCVGIFTLFSIIFYLRLIKVGI